MSEVLYDVLHTDVSSDDHGDKTNDKHETVLNPSHPSLHVGVGAPVRCAVNERGGHEGQG